MYRPGKLAVAFNAAITAADPDALAALMADDHVFVDSEGNQVTGRQACVAAWEGFFAAFPGYRNTFDEIRAHEATAVMRGRSTCPGHPELTGPALWRAETRGDQLTAWQVHDDTAENRALLWPAS
jgi:ketosteroid isomerase-like protein